MFQMSFQKLIKSKIFLIPDIRSIAQKALNLLKRFCDLLRTADFIFYYEESIKLRNKIIFIYSVECFCLFLEIRSHSVVQASLEDTIYLLLASDADSPPPCSYICWDCRLWLPHPAPT